MKISLKHVRVIMILALITSLIYSVPVEAGDDLICTETQFSVISLNLDQTKTVLACLDTFESAKESMNTLKVEQPDLIITHNSSKSPEKIIAATRAIAASYPQRRNDGTANAAIMNIFRNPNLSGDSTYMNAYRDMAYTDTITYNTTTGSGSALIQISGFVGHAHLNQIDIIPMVYIENDWLISLGGNSFTGSLAIYQIRPRMNEYRVSTSSAFGVREIYHETFSFSSATTLGVYVYGQAPDWLPNGTYYSWDSIHFFRDKAMTQPVLNGDLAGEYYNYYQYLPLRSSSNITAKQLDDYLVSLGFSKKAVPPLPREVGASSMFGEGNAFVEGQTKYGANALLVYAMGLHESGRGTSSISIEKNNIFGWGAVDINPGDAFMFDSVSSSVAVHMGRNLFGYLSVNDSRFFGSVLGNKNNGFNAKYASDPYWGNKIAGWAYRIDRSYDFPDYNYYSIGIMPEAVDLVVKKSADSSSSTMFTIPSKRLQRAVLINSLTDTASGPWVSIMSTQPVTLSDSVVMYSSSIKGLTIYEWFKSIGYLPANNIKMIYSGNGVSKIPMVYDAEEFEEGLVTSINSVGLIDGTLNLRGFGFNRGLSVPYSGNVVYKLSLEDETEEVFLVGVNNGIINVQLSIDYGQNRFVYDGATFDGTIDLKNLPAGTYNLDLIMEFDALSESIIKRKTVEFSGVIPSIHNYLGRSYNLLLKDNNLVLEINNQEISFVIGDVSENDLVTVTDLVMLRRYLAGSVVLQYKGMLAADINKDGKITTTDLVLLRRLLAEME